MYHFGYHKVICLVSIEVNAMVFDQSTLEPKITHGQHGVQEWELSKLPGNMIAFSYMIPTLAKSCPAEVSDILL